MAASARIAILGSLALLVMPLGAPVAQQAHAPILAGPLAKLDIQNARIEPGHGKPKGTLTIAMHITLDPGWLDPLEHSYAITQVKYDYFVHDALIKPMPQGEATYSLAELAEMSADYKQAAFRLRSGLKFHDGTRLTTADVKWTYENFKGANAKIFHDKLDHMQIVDDRTIVFHFKEPFIEFMDLYNGVVSGIGWIVPKDYYQKVGRDGFKAHPIGAGPYKLANQETGTQMVFEAWDEYWRRVPATKTIVVKGVRDAASRLAGLQTGELDLAYGMTGKLLSRVMADENLRWDPNFTSPWWLMFPGYGEADSPFHDKRVRQAASLSLNRTFLAKQETQGIGPPWGNWLSAEEGDALRGDGKELPVPEYNPQKAKQLLAEAGFPNGFDYEWYVPFPPYLDMAERIITDLRAVGIRGKLEVLEGPAFRAKIGQGRKGYPGNKTIVQNIDPRPGGAATNIGVYTVCGGSASFVCEPQIETLWKQHQASLDVHAVGPRVLPAGKDVHRYWDTQHAPYPWPWEIWEVKAEG